MKKRPAFWLITILAAWTAVVLACQGSGIGRISLTATPTSTETPSPTATLTPTVTASATRTPIPTGTARKNLPDGSTQFIDYDAGYEFTVPKEWMMLSQDDDIDAILRRLDLSNPDVEDLISDFQLLNKDIFRLFMLDPNPEHRHDGLPPNIIVMFDQDNLARLSPLGLLRESYEENFLKDNPGGRIISSSDSETFSNHIPIGVIETSSIDKDSSGTSIKMYEKLVFFMTNKGMVLLILATPFEFRVTAQSNFDPIVDSLLLRVIPNL